MTKKSRKDSNPTNSTCPIRLVAKGHDDREDLWYYIYETTNPDGDPIEVLLSTKEMALGEAGIMKVFSTQGFAPPLSNTKKAVLIKQLEEQDTETRVNIVSKSGWARTNCGKYYFVTPLGIVGDNAHGVRLAKSRLSQKHHFVASGTLREWQKKVLPLAEGNRLLMFVIAMAFTSPLISLMGAENGGFNLVLRSSRGKSTAATLAGSVWGGGGKHGFSENWLNTANNIDAVASTYNDTLLVLDETGLAADKKPSDVANLILNTAYRLAHGERKGRLPDTEMQDDWSLYSLSTSEKTTTELAVVANIEVKTGQLVRFTDIIADAGASMGLFENLHGSDSAGDFSKRIRKAALQSYGTAAQHFLEKLVEWQQSDADGLRSWLEKRMEFYKKKAKKFICSGETDRISDRFALIYAAARLAKRFKILKWENEDSLDAILFAHSQVQFDDIERCAATSTKSNVEICDLIKTTIQEIQPSLLNLHKDKAARKNFEIEAQSGFIHKTPGGGNELLFWRETFLKYFCAELSFDRVFSALKAEGLIIKQKGGKNGVTRTLAGENKSKRFIGIKAKILEC